MLGFGALGQQALASRPLGVAGRHIVAAGTGTFTITGQSVGLRPVRSVIAGTGTFTLSGQGVTFLYGKTMSAAHGTFTITGQATAYSRTRVLAASPGTFTLSGQTVTLRKASYLTAARGTFTLSGQVVDFVRGKIRQLVKDPEVAQKLLPHDHGIGTGRHGRSGEDAGHLARLQRLTAVACRNTLRHPQHRIGAGQVGAAHGIAVHG